MLIIHSAKPVVFAVICWTQ